MSRMGCSGKNFIQISKSMGISQNAYSVFSFSFFMQSLLKKYATFGGRASRKEYWNFLIYAAILGLTSYAIAFWFLRDQIGREHVASLRGVGILPVVLILPLASLIVRRLHDAACSGWLSLLMAVPFANIILVILLSFNSGTVGQNRYGPDPRRALRT
jgi:uncharacterized membrane protein YhaH (DUF805 family)